VPSTVAALLVAVAAGGSGRGLRIMRSARTADSLAMLYTLGYWCDVRFKCDPGFGELFLFQLGDSVPSQKKPRDQG
jgi:hypothetical protein